jgi:lysostaphin
VKDAIASFLFAKGCEENGQLFDIGQLKRDPNHPIKISALNLGKNRYQANNGSFCCLVTPERVEVWQNGSQIP